MKIWLFARSGSKRRYCRITMATAHKLKLLVTSLSAGALGYVGWRALVAQDEDVTLFEANMASERIEGKKTHRQLFIPTRKEQVEALKSGEQYDILVIGGGVTGCGVALDAVTRGLNVALVERDDISSGTSSRSTKLIHGGVRYLQKAIMGFDREQYRLVKEALHERANLLEIAPHLSHPLPIMLPVYSWWQIPYYWIGIKMYDLVAGKKLIKPSFFVSKRRALEEFPMLKANKLCGAIVYYDGQHNDARMNIAIALTAAREGARIANHVEVLSLIKEKNRVRGALVKDKLTGKEWDIYAKVVVNATGPFTDQIRHLDDPLRPNICQPSAGIHIVLPDYYSPRSMGLLDPSTSDGRVIFFLPWEGKAIAGTTDSPTEVTHLPHPTEEDIRFILQEIKDYLSPDISVRRGDVLAAWCGIRPLVIDPNKKDTQAISRNHVIDVSDSKMVTIAGGKWTTYRAMARDTVNTAVEVGGLNDPRGCQTDGFILDGGEGWQPTLFIRLVQDYGVDVEVAQHLAKTYGDKAPRVAEMAHFTGRRWPVKGRRLVQEFPYIEADVIYAIKEYACNVVDVIARRTSLAFLNSQAAEEALPIIVEIMGKELGWSKAEKKAQLDEGKSFLQTMGLKARSDVRDVEIKLSYKEAKHFTEIFKSLDTDKDGHIDIYDLRKALSNMGEKLSDKELRDLIAEVDINKNATIEEEEFLQLMSALQTGEVSNSRMAVIIERRQKEMDMSVRRSGGGL